ncbi:hypothetical protein JTE90_012125, partial [Oedothorax gibbosus]
AHANGSDNPGMEDVAEEEEEGSKRLSPKPKVPHRKYPHRYERHHNKVRGTLKSVSAHVWNHEGKEVLNDIFPMSVDQVFKSLFFSGDQNFK